jgi:hypothetical protein
MGEKRCRCRLSIVIVLAWKELKINKDRRDSLFSRQRYAPKAGEKLPILA